MHNKILVTFAGFFEEFVYREKIAPIIVPNCADYPVRAILR